MELLVQRWIGPVCLYEQLHGQYYYGRDLNHGSRRTVLQIDMGRAGSDFRVKRRHPAANEARREAACRRETVNAGG